jgi:hypothetical protein
MTSENTAKKQTEDGCSDDVPGKSPIVKVTFTTPPDDFEFSCTQVRMRAAGKIQFHQMSPTDEWVFLRAEGLPPSEFKVDVEGNGKTMTIDDKHITAPKNYDYTITVRDSDGGDHTSPRGIVTAPPMIRNL